MFTGLIEKVCTVSSVSNNADSMRLTIDLDSLANDAKIGDSIAINGTCLTIVKLAGSRADFDVSGETLAISTVGSLKPSAKVNAERAMKASSRFGGHFVQGHIDGKAAIKAITNKGKFRDVTFAAAADLLDMMIPKGSVAVDGISLTIAAVDQQGFTVAIIPETWNNTNLANSRVGDIVNIETDIITKTVKKQLEKIMPQKSSLTIDKLKELGF